MLWQMPNGNLLLKTQTHTLTRFHTGNFLSAEINRALQDEVFNNIGSFAEIMISKQINGLNEIKDHLSEVIFKPEKEEYLKIGNRILGEVVETFGAPKPYCIEDYAYLGDLHVIRKNTFVKYLLSEQCYRGFFGEIKENVIYDNLRILSH
jgi:hypothetical protein